MRLLGSKSRGAIEEEWADPASNGKHPAAMKKKAKSAGPSSSAGKSRSRSKGRDDAQGRSSSSGDKEKKRSSSASSKKRSSSKTQSGSKSPHSKKASSSSNKYDVTGYEKGGSTGEKRDPPASVRRSRSIGKTPKSGTSASASLKKSKSSKSAAAITPTSNQAKLRKSKTTDTAPGRSSRSLSKSKSAQSGRGRSRSKSKSKSDRSNSRSKSQQKTKKQSKKSQDKDGSGSKLERIQSTRSGRSKSRSRSKSKSKSDSGKKGSGSTRSKSKDSRSRSKSVKASRSQTPSSRRRSSSKSSKKSSDTKKNKKDGPPSKTRSQTPKKHRSHSKDKSKKSKGKKKKKSGSASDQVIESVPTASGYHSDDSVEDLIEERSRYSRYSLGGALDDGSVDKQDAEKKGKRDDDSSVGINENFTDKYSRTPAVETDNLYPDRNGSLWSDSTEDAPQWREGSPTKAGGKRTKVARSPPGSPTYSESYVVMDVEIGSIDEVADPIYTKPPKSERSARSFGASSHQNKYDVSSHKSVMERKQKAADEEAAEVERNQTIPNVLSDTSSLTDPMMRTLQGKEQKTSQDQPNQSFINNLVNKTTTTASPLFRVFANTFGFGEDEEPEAARTTKTKDCQRRTPPKLEPVASLESSLGRKVAKGERDIQAALSGATDEIEVSVLEIPNVDTITTVISDNDEDPKIEKVEDIENKQDKTDRAESDDDECSESSEEKLEEIDSPKQSPQKLNAFRRLFHIGGKSVGTEKPKRTTRSKSEKESKSPRSGKKSSVKKNQTKSSSNSKRGEVTSSKSSKSKSKAKTRYDSPASSKKRSSKVKKKQGSQDPVEDSRSLDSKKHSPSENKRSGSDNLALKLSESEKHVMYSKSLMSEESVSGITSPKKKTSVELTELDEYENGGFEVTSTQAPLVQCLKFYYCGKAADATETILSAASCTPKHSLIDQKHFEEDDEVMTQRMYDDVGFRRRSQGEEGYITGLTIKTTRRGAAAMDGQDGLYESTSDLEEAPEINKHRPLTPTVAREVTDIHLKLSEDTEATRRDEAMLQGKLKENEGTVSVTSILVDPAASASASLQSSSASYSEEEKEEADGEFSFDEYEESSFKGLTEMMSAPKLPDYTKKKGLRGLFSRARGKAH